MMTQVPCIRRQRQARYKIMVSLGNTDVQITWAAHWGSVSNKERRKEGKGRRKEFIGKKNADRMMGQVGEGTYDSLRIIYTPDITLQSIQSATNSWQVMDAAISAR